MTLLLYATYDKSKISLKVERSCKYVVNDIIALCYVRQVKNIFEGVLTKIGVLTYIGRLSLYTTTRSFDVDLTKANRGY